MSLLLADCHVLGRTKKIDCGTKKNKTTEENLKG
jgi:hypothetical protein